MRQARLIACMLVSSMVVGATGVRAVVTGSTPSLTPAKASATRSSHFVDPDLALRRRVAKPARVNVVDNAQFIDVNNIKMFVTNTGSFAWDKTTGNSGLEYPKGTGKTCVFAAGLWIGGQVGGETRVAVSEYSDEYGPGAMIGANPDDATKAEYKVYKLFRKYPDAATRDAALADYNAGAVAHGAPAVTVQSDGSLDILGDEQLWAVYNDADVANHSNRAGTTNPLGVEVQQTTFAFNRQGALGSTVFISYKLINKGGNTIDNMYVSQWSDPDDGYAGDDLVGCDTTLSVGYVYNGTSHDNVYGTSVPSVGYDFFQGPKVGGVPLPMTSFNKYINGTDPDNFTKTYNLMKGLQQDGSVWINPTTGLPTTFQVSGDPTRTPPTGWLDTNPADRRLQLSSGPFTFAPNDTQVVTCAIIVGQSHTPLTSIALMKFYDAQAQLAFDLNFHLPPPPDAPKVVATPTNGGVQLTWDRSSEDYDVSPFKYKWEGYVVYQGASIAGPWTRLGTFDRIDTITVVTDSLYNVDQGLILPTGTAFGSDAGTQYSLNITSDVIRGGPLHNGTPYYFSVDAYSVDMSAILPFPHVLESAFNPITVVPQTPAGGVDLASASVSKLTQGQYTTGVLPSTDDVSVTVIDPLQMKNASYKVGFKPACDTCSTLAWYLVRTSDAPPDTVIKNWTDFSADQQNQVIDGLLVTVASFPTGELIFKYTPVGAPALAGADRGLPFFSGGAGYAADDLGGTIPSGSPAPSTEIRFTGGAAGQKAYRYLRTLIGGNRVYEIQDYVDVPFTVWDITNNRQLTAAFLENDGSPTQDGKWDPDDAADGEREIVWVDSTAYSATPDAARMPGGDPNLADVLLGNLPFLWEFSSHLITPTSVIQNGDKAAYLFSTPSTPNDYFTFTTTAANRFNASLAKGELDRVLAVPNPYFNHSEYELNQFGRVVKFTHLPAVCKLRIFNLAGDLVRTIDKNDNTSQLSWDLLTDRGLPVSSGVYVFHVDAPSVGTKVGKVAIFMEKERLNTY